MKLLEALERRHKQIKDVEKLEAILNRPDGDFFVYRRWRDSSLATVMRWDRCPVWAWDAWKVVLSVFLNKGFC